jgi:transcriptional regulator with XRE-family HTH domain
MITTFGELVKDARLRNKWTLRDAAKIVGIPHASLNEIENGKNKNPRFSQVTKIVDVFNFNWFTVLYLFRMENWK